MITHSDEGSDFEPDDPLAVILRPASDYLGPPAGRYEAIRRGAARRRLLRTAVGVGSVCAVAALVALPVRLSTSQAPTSPTVPLAPPSEGSPSAVPPTPQASPESVSPSPTPGRRTAVPTQTARTTGRATTRPAVPTPAPSSTPTTPVAEPSIAPSIAPSGSPSQ